MAYITYQIKGIQEQFVMPINQGDDVQYITSRVKKDFGIIPKLSAKIYGSYLQNSSVLSQSVRCQDVITFEAIGTDGNEKKLDFYRQPIITPRYKSEKTFIVFSTVNFKSMTKGDKIQVNANDTEKELKEKVKNMLCSKYKSNINANLAKKINIILFLPGGIPLIPKVKLGEFFKSFPDFMPHLYAIVVTNAKIMTILDKKFNNVCNIKDEDLKLLLSPDFDSEIDGLCEIASVLGYIQQNGQNVKQMIYSIAKFCPFAPMINGLYSLSCLSQATGREILQITLPLSTLFTQIGNFLSDQSNLFASTAKFLTYFMNIKISDRIPCTEFIRPFYNIGFEKYFYDHLSQEKGMDIESIIAFDPDFRDQDWITFELPKLTVKDFESAMNLTKTLEIIPPMSLREMHRVSLFRGTNGPWLFLSASSSKEESDRDKIDYINPEIGQIETATYEDVSVKTIGVSMKDQSNFDKLVVSSIDPEKVKQLVIICVDKSGSMGCSFDAGYNRFVAAQKFFIKFTQACYRYHTTSLYGSIMFNKDIDVRNGLNPLPKNFADKMIIENEKPRGGTNLFLAIKSAGQLLLDANTNKKYPNAVLRVIVISDGEDIYATSNDMAQTSNFILSNQIRVDAIIVSNEIAKELVALSHHSGGVSMFPPSFKEGLDLFNKEEFFNVDLRQFGQLHAPNLSARDFNSLPQVTVADLDSEIKIKPNEYIKPDKLVTSPLYAISEFNKEVQKQGDGAEENFILHPSQKRIIRELQKIVNDPREDVKVYPLKDQIDVWRVLIKGLDGSLYAGKWFYMIIEFPGDYPQHYPLFRFVYPPFHPNITEQGRDSPEDWISMWNVQKDGKLCIESKQLSVPEQYICPIARKIMKEPVKATSGVYYEKRALEKYLRSTDNPTCRVKIENKKPVPLPFEQNMNLVVDNKMKATIQNWIQENNYHEDEDDADEEMNIIEFNKSGIKIDKPTYVKNFDSSSIPSSNYDLDDDDANDFNSIHPSSRPRPELSDK